MFAGSQRLPRDARSHGVIGVELVGRHELLDPLETEGTAKLGEAYGIFFIGRHPAIEHKFHSIAHRFTRARDKLHVFVQPFKPMRRAKGGEDFGSPKA